MNDKKKIVIGILCLLIIIMAVGYALLAQKLSIIGTTNITSNWQIEITDIREIENIGSGRTISTSYDATTATFNNEVIHTGDKITYEITVTNKGTLDALLENYMIDKGDNEDIVVNIVGQYRNKKLVKNGGTNKIIVSMQYNPEATTQPTKSSNTISIELYYAQDSGKGVDRKAYSIGDKIEFAGSNWYVIKASSEEDDYVTLLKEKVLSNTEVGNYASTTSTGNMHFYYDDDTCYSAGGSPEAITTSGCKHEYDNSLIKEMLETRYLPSIDESNLKEIDGYKIRLITFNELTEQLGYKIEAFHPSGTGWKGTEAPPWTYRDFGEENNNEYSGYWTMSQHESNQSAIWCVGQDSVIRGSGVYRNFAVRPVINLLKTSIVE